MTLAPAAPMSRLRSFAFRGTLVVACLTCCRHGTSAPVARAADDPAPAAPAAPAGEPTASVAEPEWSRHDTATTPQGGVRFHGPFTKEQVDVTCDGLGAHDFLEVSFDLLVLRSWDGSVPVEPLGNGRPAAIGPDFFRLALLDGPTLLYTTFSNNPDERFKTVSLTQNYPSQIPGEHLPHQTGARAANTLGYCYPWPGPPQPIPMDATYRVRFLLPHRGPRAVVELSAMNLQDLIDESWGVADLRVNVLSETQVTRPTRDAIAAAFQDALEGDPAGQPERFQTLILGMDDTADWVRENVTPQPVDAARVAKLIGFLAADDTEVDRRETAAIEIRKLGPQVEPLLRDVRTSAPAEQRQRIDWLLQNIGVTPIPEKDLRRVLLATRALEIIGTPKAMDVRRKLVSAVAERRGEEEKGQGEQTP